MFLWKKILTAIVPLTLHWKLVKMTYTGTNHSGASERFWLLDSAMENRDPDAWGLRECRRSKKMETSHAVKPNEASDLQKGQRCVFENWKKGERFPLLHITTPPETKTDPMRKATRTQVRL